MARELAPARLRSSRNPVDAVHLKEQGVWFWGRVAAQREQVSSPQVLSVCSCPLLVPGLNG
ncbi:hypothetical protein EMIT0P171_70141 [Pseudomonas sp. IT-P171]